MELLFWQKGFYFERRLFYFNNLTFSSLLSLPGISSVFFTNLMLRFNFFKLSPNSFVFNKSLVCRSDGEQYFKNMNLRLIFVKLTLINFPVLLEFKVQLRYNIWRYFLIEVRRGIYLKLNKPLYRRSRSRTFYRKNQTKRSIIEKPSRLRRSTSVWF